MTSAPPYARPRAVVTGGAGFLGSHVCEALVASGHDVVCVDNGVTGSPANVDHLVGAEGFELHELDVSEGLDVPGRVDLVLHLASPASPPDYLRLPVETLLVGSEGTRHALELARLHGARFLLASTSEVYGDPLVHPQPETYWGNVNPIGPRGVYDEAKRFAEALTTAYRTAHGVDTAIVRIFNTYGTRMRVDDGRVIPTFISQALAGEPLTVYGDGSQTRSLCHVDDTVRGLLALASSGHPGPVNIGNPHELTVLEIARTIVEATGSSSSVVHADLPVDDPKVRCPDIGRARAVLGWEPQVPLAEGLASTIEWFAATRVPA
jgi:dTDP-glucose 4,6-dehydratase